MLKTGNNNFSPISSTLICNIQDKSYYTIVIQLKYSLSEMKEISELNLTKIELNHVD